MLILRNKIYIGHGRNRTTIAPFDKPEREGVAMAIARQWSPSIKSKAQAKRKKNSTNYAKRGKIRYSRHRHENPLDFAMSPERLAIAEATADLTKIFGPILEPVETYRPRRGRRTNAEIKAVQNLNLDDI